VAREKEVSLEREVRLESGPYTPSAEEEEVSAKEEFYRASQWQLIWKRFKKHRLAIVGSSILALFGFVAIFCEFLSPYSIGERNAKYGYSPPARIHFIDRERGLYFRPFVYGLQSKRDPETQRKIYTEDKTKAYPVRFFVRGDEYKFWNLFPANIHLFGVEKGGVIFTLGTDELGRDLLSRLLYATRISLSVGLVGVVISFILGCILGGISGYYGGSVDTIIQRVIEFLLAIPTIPLWMGLAAAMPHNWSPIKTYFSITIILSLINWCYLARVVRGKLLELREEDFVMAAKIAGASEGRIITRHLLPSFMSYLIVNLTLAVPYTILGETALSFLGIGLQAPAVSWGVLLKDAQNVQTVALNPWLLTPVFFVILAVLAFNFIGDGLRDAADPYK